MPVLPMNKLIQHRFNEQPGRGVAFFNYDIQVLRNRALPR